MIRGVSLQWTAQMCTICNFFKFNIVTCISHFVDTFLLRTSDQSSVTAVPKKKSIDVVYEKKRREKEGIFNDSAR
jgi:hypothetical protein